MARKLATVAPRKYSIFHILLLISILMVSESQVEQLGENITGNCVNNTGFFSVSKCIIKWIMLQLLKPTKACCLQGELLKFHPNTWLHDTWLLWPTGQMTSGLGRS